MRLEPRHDGTDDAAGPVLRVQRNRGELRRGLNPIFVVGLIVARARGALDNGLCDL